MLINIDIYRHKIHIQMKYGMYIHFMGNEQMCFSHKLVKRTNEMETYMK